MPEYFNGETNQVENCLCGRCAKALAKPEPTNKKISKGNEEKKHWNAKHEGHNIICPKCKYDQFYRPLGGDYQFVCGRCWFRVGKLPYINKKIKDVHGELREILETQIDPDKEFEINRMIEQIEDVFTLGTNL